MSKSSRRRLSFASLRDVALVSLLSATFVGSVGCSGGSNPFCCNSKEKSQIDNLERAQSLDENEKNSTSNEDEEDFAEPQQDKKAPIHANILRSNGSGDATQIAAATTPKTFAQEVPVTASTTAAQDAPAENADSAGLLPAPILAQPSQTPQPAQPVPAESATPSETASEEISETPLASTAQTTDEVETNADEKPASESQDAQNTEEAQEETAVETAPAETETSDAQEEKTPETPINAARSSRRNGGPQRAAGSAPKRFPRWRG